MPNTKTISHSQLTKIYSAIKNDDLNSFKNYFSLNNQIIYLKSKTKENLLFYCLERKSLKIFDFILNQNESLLLEKNSMGYNCITNTINKSLFEEVSFFLEHIDKKTKEKLSNTLDDKGNSLLAISLLKDEKYFQLYKKHFSQSIDVEHINLDGQSIAHIIAYKNAYYAKELLNKSNVSKKDNKGVSPFLLAARYSSYPLFEIISKYSDIYEKNILNSNALHFCAYSGDVDKLDFLLKEGLNPVDKNLYDTSPLSVSLNEKKYEYAFNLIKKIKKINFEDLLMVTRAIEKKPEIFDYLIQNEHLYSEELNDVESKKKFLSHMFYYAPESKLRKYEDFIKKLIPLDNNVINSLYFSAIAGRKDFLYKTNYLTQNYGWSKINHQYFNNFLKDHPCGFIYSLNQLPKTQFESLFTNSKILLDFSSLDKIVFKLLCINKNSDIHENIENFFNFKEIKDSAPIIDLLKKTTSDNLLNHINFFEQLSQNNEIKDMIVEKIAQSIFYTPQSIKTFKEFFSSIQSKELKKEIYIKLNEILLSEDITTELDIIFKNKYTLMENVLNKMLKQCPEKFNNTKYLYNNNYINIEPDSCYLYLKTKNFNKKELFIIKKSKDFINYFKSIDVNKEKEFSIDFFKMMMLISPQKDKMGVLNKFLEYSSYNKDISPHSYNYYINQFTSKEQKNIIKNSLMYFLKKSGSNKDIYELLEKKYLTFFSENSLKNNILKNANINLLFYKINKNEQFINIFSSNEFQVKEEFNVWDILDFDKKIELLKKDVPEVNNFILKQFIEVPNYPINCFKKILEIDSKNDIDSYKKVIEKLANEISKLNNKNEVSNLLDVLLFKKPKEIQKLVFENDIIINSNDLTKEQSSYILSQRLQKSLKITINNKKRIKI